MGNFIENYIEKRIKSMSQTELKAIITPLDLQAIPKEDTQYTNTRVSSSEHTRAELDKEAYVHRHEVIKELAIDYRIPKDREIMAQHHPYQSANIKKVCKYVCMELPVFAKPNKGEDEEPEEDEFVIKEWKRLQLQKAWKKCMKKARTHGWCIYYPFKPSQMPTWYKGPPFKVFTIDEATPIEWDDNLGHPIKWHIHPTNKHTKPFDCSITECVFFDPYDTDDFDGEPEGLDIWDDLVDYIWISDAINAFDQRLGNGFMVIGVPMNTTEAQMNDIRSRVRKVRTEMGLVIRMDVDQPVTVAWQAMAGAQVDFIAHLTKIEERFCMSMGFPRRWLIGDAEGAMESSGKDALQVNISLKAIFNQWIPFITQLLIYHKLISSPEDIEIKPAFELQLSEQEKVTLAQIKTATIAAKAWLTDDEKRQLDGYAPMTQEQKDAKMNENNFQIGFGSNNSGDKNGSKNEENPSKNTQKQPIPKPTKTDSYSILADLFTDNNQSIRDLAAILDVSPTTISKIRAKFDSELKPVIKCDSISFKEDSIILNGSKFKIEDVPLVLPQERYYEYLGRNCVRTPEAIQKAFNDPKTPREFRIGITPNGDHKTKVPLEILDENCVGRVILKRIDENGNIRGDIEGDLTESDKVLGADNWLKESILKKEYPSTSVALYSKDKPSNGKYIEDNLDIRSFVFTRSPRNKEAGKV